MERMRLKLSTSGTALRLPMWKPHSTNAIVCYFPTVPSAAGIKADDRQTNGDLSSLAVGCTCLPAALPGREPYIYDGQHARCLHRILLFQLLCSLRVRHGCVRFVGESLCRRSKIAQNISGESTYVNPGQAVGVYQIQATEIEICQPPSSRASARGHGCARREPPALGAASSPSLRMAHQELCGVHPVPLRWQPCLPPQQK